MLRDLRTRVSLVSSILVLLLSLTYLSNQSISIIRDGEFENPDLWLPHFHEPGRGTRSEISNGMAYLETNDTRGRWIASWVQQGFLPHMWLDYSVQTELATETVFRRWLEATPNVFFIRVEVSRSELTFYNDTGSQINAGVIMWFDIGKGYNGTDAQVLDLEIRFLTAHFMNGSVSHHEREFARLGDPEPRPNFDYHIFTAAPVMLEDTEFHFIDIDLGHYVGKAFHLLERDLGVALDEATLRLFSLCVQANYGHTTIAVEKVECIFSPRINSIPVMLCSGLYGISAFFVVFFLCSIYRRIRKAKAPSSTSMSSSLVRSIDAFCGEEPTCDDGLGF